MFFFISQSDGLLIMLAEKYSQISTNIMDVCARSSNLLMKVLNDEYQVFQHFEGLRSYMLIGRGDFYAYIIFKLEYVYVLTWNYAMIISSIKINTKTRLEKNDIKDGDVIKGVFVRGQKWHSLPSPPLTRIIFFRWYIDLFENLTN